MIDLRDKQALRHLAEVVAAIRAHAPEADFLLVGAAARDLLLFYRHGIAPRRRTTDIDFAFSVRDWAAFERLKTDLVGSGRFTLGRPAHRLLDPSGPPLDMVPFGGVESPAGRIAWPPDDNPSMSVVGYDAALASSETALLPGDRTLAVVALPMLALLKLFAWEERHLDQPRKDAGDLAFVLDAAFRIVGLERLYDEAPALFELGDFDPELAGAWLLGVQARRTVDRHSPRAPAIIACATAILERETDPAGPLRLIGELRAADPERARHTLAAFRNGMRLLAELRDARR